MTDPSDRLRVLIADDHPAVREQLGVLLAGEVDLALVGVAAHGFEALRLVRQLVPDVLVLDQAMPGLDGLAVLRAVRDERLPTRVVFYVLESDACREAEAAGATACVTKDESLDLVLDAVRAAGAFSRTRRRGSKQSAETRRAGSQRVLIVDDDADVRRVVCESLESAGYTTREASDGQEAIQSAADFDPDVIVLDLVLPLVGGREVLRAYREMPNARAKIVALSALSKAPEIARELGCDAGLRKPFDLEQLLTTIDGLASG